MSNDISRRAIPTSFLANNFGCLYRFAAWIGADEAVISALAWRAAVAMCGLATLQAIATGLTPNEQGYYFTFNSLLGMRVFLDLSFSYVISIMASHEARGIRWEGRNFRISPGENAKRLGTLVRIVSRWYAGGGVVLFMGAVIAGSRLFAHQANTANWRGPWLAACFAESAVFTSTPYYSVLEGCGQIALVARLRTIGVLFSSVLFWIALKSGLGLYSAAVPAFVQAIYEWTVFSTRWREFLVTLYRMGQMGSVTEMLREVWPFQWKMAVSAMSGYFMTTMLVPLTFANLGAAKAGTVGMSLSFLGAASTLSLTWMNTKAPVFGTLISRCEFETLDKLFRRTVIQAMGIITIGVVILTAGVAALYATHNPFSARLVDPVSFALLGSWSIMNVLVVSEAIYLRAHKKEPFLLLSLLSGICLSGATILVVKSGGVRGVALVYSFVQIGLTVYATFEFVRRRREWHRTPAAGGQEGPRTPHHEPEVFSLHSEL